jgi:hypothetical protein
LRARGTAWQHTKYPHWLYDVLDGLFAQVLKAERKLISDLVVDSMCDANAAGFGQALQAGCDVHSIAVKLIALHNHVAEVYADTELHSAFGGQSGVLGL